MPSTFRFTRLALPCLLVAPAAWATDVPSAEQAGAGGTSTADPRDNAGVMINPASIGLRERYDISGMYIGGPDGAHRWHASAVDGRTNDYVAFGLAYNGAIESPPFHPDQLPGWAPSGEELRNKRQTHDITFGLSAPFLDRRMSIGINGTLMIYNGEFIGSGVTGNMDLGFMAQPIEYLSVGLVGKNLLPVVDQQDIPTTISLGVRGGKEDLIEAMVDVDARVENIINAPWGVRAGLEGTIKWVRLRGGWDWDADRAYHRIGWGLGIHSDVGTIDYAMQLPLTSDQFAFSSVTHTVSLTVWTNLANKEAEDAPIRWQDER